jgi:hypothetical protein
VRQLSVAAIVLVLLTGSIAFLLFRLVPWASGRSSNAQQPVNRRGANLEDHSWWADRPWRPAISAWMEQQVRIRRATWATVSHVCVHRDDFERIRERYLAMSETAAQERLSSALGLRIMYVATVSLVHVLVYVYLARQVGENVTSARNVTSGWWATVPLLVSSVLAVLLITLVRFSPKTIIFAFSCLGSALCLVGIWGPSSGPRL